MHESNLWRTSLKKVHKFFWVNALFFQKSLIFSRKIIQACFFVQTSSPEYNTTVHHVWKQSLKDFFKRSLWQSFFNLTKVAFSPQNEDFSKNFLWAKTYTHMPTFWCPKFVLSVNFGTRTTAYSLQPTDYRPTPTSLHRLTMLKHVSQK